MADNIFEKVKEQVSIADVVSHFGVKLNGKDKALYPFHNEKTPSFSIKRDENIFCCFGCGEKGDAVHFVSKLKNIEPLEAANLIAETFGVAIDNTTPKSKKLSTKAIADIKLYIESCAKNAYKTDYFTRRGLTNETVKNFNLGFDTTTQSIVIPYNKKLSYYQTRSISGRHFFKPRTDEAGAEPLFNIETLHGADRQPVFVVESPICAMSIIQCGGVNLWG